MESCLSDRDEIGREKHLFVDWGERGRMHWVSVCVGLCGMPDIRCAPNHRHFTFMQGLGEMVCFEVCRVISLHLFQVIRQLTNWYR